MELILGAAILVAAWIVRRAINHISDELTRSRLLREHIAIAQGVDLSDYAEDVTTWHTGIPAAKDL